MDDVPCILRDVSALSIEPRFNALGDLDARCKSPGEVVTIADEEAEEALRRRLRDLLRGSTVVGEEACSADPTLVAALGGERTWLVDPLDGTANFVAGSTDWAVMVALIERGTTSASWIWRPAASVMYMAERGAGATRNGISLTRDRAPLEVADLHGAVLTRFLDETTATAVAANAGRFKAVTAGHRCAGVDYPALVEGDEDFVLFWRTLPWDHAPGALLVQEAGALVRRLDGGFYQPTQTSVGLLAAADEQTWNTTRATLFGDRHLFERHPSRLA